MLFLIHDAKLSLLIRLANTPKMVFFLSVNLSDVFPFSIWEYSARMKL
jgi:hypothetical protein